LAKHQDVINKTQVIMRSIRTMRAPLLELQRIEWDHGKQRRIDEGIGSLIKVVSVNLIKQGLQQTLGISPSLVNAATNAFNKGKKPLCSIVPKKKTTHTAMDVDAGPSTGGVLGSVKPKKVGPQQRMSGDQYRLLMGLEPRANESADRKRPAHSDEWIDDPP
jgi:hypothetical protein